MQNLNVPVRYDKGRLIKTTYTRTVGVALLFIGTYMTEKKITVTAPEGLHTRPAKAFSEAAKKYVCDVTLCNGSKESPGKNLIKLMKLGISCGTEVTLRCSGPDEQEACEKLSAFIAAIKD